ncbi:MAG: serine hydrolase [bacterium]
MKISKETENIKQKVDEYINAISKLNPFSGSILIAVKEHILVTESFGMADYEHNIPNTPKTKFRIGSNTKSFTALAIMQLHERGIINVNDALAKYLPDYPAAQKITIHHLLTHTSGIPDYNRFPDSIAKKTLPASLTEMIEEFKNEPLDFVPGEEFRYSSSGYILLSYIIEKMSEKSYEDFLTENIFNPLDMNNTKIDRHDAIIKNRAVGYTLGEKGLVNARYTNVGRSSGAGGLLSTVEDMYLWDRALYTEKLTTKDSLEKIFTPFRHNYGYGWFIGKYLNRKMVNHGGRSLGFVADIMRFIDDDTCVIILSNYDYISLPTISKTLAAIAFGEKYELPKQPIAIELNNILDEYVGAYQFQPHIIITITKEDGRLFGQMSRQAKIQIWPESETEFFSKIPDWRITFINDKKGKITELILHYFGIRVQAKRIK